MRRKLVLAAAMLLLSSLLFAGNLYISLDTVYSLPMKGWGSSDMQNGLDDNLIEEKFLGGAAVEAGLGYEFNDVFRMGLHGGIGFNQTRGTHTLYTVPFALDLNCRMFSIGVVDFRTGLSLGGYGRIFDNVLHIGPMAALELGAEVRFTEHFIFGFSSRAVTLVELYNDFKGIDVELDYIPMAMSVKFAF